MLNNVAVLQLYLVKA